MNTNLFYYVCDIIATAFEGYCLYMLLRAVVPYKHNIGKFLGIYLTYIMLVFSLTSLDTAVWVKALVQVVYLMVAHWKVFSIPSSITGHCAMLFFLCAGSGDMIILLGYELFHLEPFVTVNGASYPVWHFNLIAHLVMLGIILLIAKWITPFLQTINNRKIVLPLVGVAVLFGLSEVIYLVSSEADEMNLIIGGALSILGMYFVGLFLYIYAKKYVFAEKEMEQEKLRNSLLQQQYNYYQQKLKDEERVRSIYHDFKNHLLVLQSQIANSREAQSSIEQLKNQMQVYEDYHCTGNDFLDIIIHDKAGQAREKGIDFNAVIHFQDGNFIESLDISTIFGNALDNAIEASEQLSEEQRLITVKTKRIREMLMISVENNAVTNESGEYQSTKPDLFLHGFGITNIKKVVEKYAGQCYISQSKGSFALKILIPIPK